MSEIFRRMSSFVRVGFIWVFTFNFSVYEMLSFPRYISTCIIIHLKINNYAVSNAPEVRNASFVLKKTKRRLLSKLLVFSKQSKSNRKTMVVNTGNPIKQNRNNSSHHRFFVVSFISNSTGAHFISLF